MRGNLGGGTSILGWRDARVFLEEPREVGGGREVIVHVYAGSAAKDIEGRVPVNNEAGAVDHIALMAQGFLSLPAPIEAERRYEASQRFFNPQEYVS
jgi:hypothetical protein